MQPQFGRVFDRNDPLFMRNKATQHVEHRCFARAGAAADQNAFAIDHAGSHKHGGGLADGSQFDQVVHRHPLNWKLANRQTGPEHGQRWNDRIHPRAVGQARVDQRLAFVDPPADLGNDSLDDRFGNFFRDKPPAGVLNHPVALHIDLIATDHHDFADGRGAEQILQRPEAEDDVLEIFLEHPQHQILAQLAVQMRPNQRKYVDEAILDTLDFLADVGQLFEI